MTHPYLIDPERASAFVRLCQLPVASERQWATVLGWTPSKVHRFIARLIELGLAETIVTPWGTSFKPLPSAAVQAAEAPKQDRSAVAARVQQGCSKTEAPHPEASRSGSSVSRCNGAPANGGNAEAMTCIAIVNETLGNNFGANYKPISPDNYGSHNAVVQWIQAGMPLETMTRLLRMKAMVFNPEKSGGELPRSLGYFTRWMLKEWAIEQRQIPLPLMTVSHQPRRERLVKPVALGDVLADLNLHQGNVS